MSFVYLCTLFVGYCNYRTIWQCISFQAAIGSLHRNWFPSKPWIIIVTLNGRIGLFSRPLWTARGDSHETCERSNSFWVLRFLTGYSMSTLLLMEEILLTSWDVSNHVNNGIKYQPPLVIAGFLPSTVLHWILKVPPIFHARNMWFPLRKKQIRSLEFLRPICVVQALPVLISYEIRTLSFREGGKKKHHFIETNVTFGRID